MTHVFVSKNNTMTGALAANEIFVGIKDSLISFQEIDINVGGYPSESSGTLYFEFSPNGSDWDVSVPLYLANLYSPPITLRTILPYFRVRFINDSTPIEQFRLTTVFHKETALRLTRFLSQPIDDNEPVEVVRVAKSVLPDGAATEATLLSIASSLGAVNQKTLYDIQDTVIYLGTAALGSASSDSVWTIKKITLDANGLPTSSLFSNNTAIWDDRTTEVYS